MRSMDVRSWKVPMGRVLRRTEAPFDADLLALGQGCVAEACEQVVEIVAQADGPSPRYQRSVVPPPWAGWERS